MGVFPYANNFVFQFIADEIKVCLSMKFFGRKSQVEFILLGLVNSDGYICY